MSLAAEATTTAVNVGSCQARASPRPPDWSSTAGLPLGCGE